VEVALLLPLLFTQQNCINGAAACCDKWFCLPSTLCFDTEKPFDGISLQLCNSNDTSVSDLGLYTDHEK
jgi:hypothetical protein